MQGMAMDGILRNQTSCDMSRYQCYPQWEVGKARNGLRTNQTPG